MNNLIILGAKYLILAPVAIALWYFYKNKDSRSNLLKFSAFSLPISYALGLIARALYNNPRPFVSEGITPLIQHVANNGFPSDHTLLAGALAGVIGKYDRRLGVLLWLLAITIGASRVLAGLHHVIDVVASIIISALVARVIYSLKYGR